MKKTRKDRPSNPAPAPSNNTNAKTACQNGSPIFFFHEDVVESPREPNNGSHAGYGSAPATRRPLRRQPSGPFPAALRWRGFSPFLLHLITLTTCQPLNAHATKQPFLAAPVANSNRVARCVFDRRRGCRRRGVEYGDGLERVGRHVNSVGFLVTTGWGPRSSLLRSRLQSMRSCGSITTCTVAMGKPTVRRNTGDIGSTCSLQTI